MIRILIADDHTVVREGIRSLLVREHDMEVVGEVGDGHSAVRFALKNQPDIVIMDIGMRELNGIEATRHIVAATPHPRVIGLSMHTQSSFVSEMLRAGASGYLPKDCPSDELLTAVRTVAAGQTYLSPTVAGALVQNHILQRGTKPAAIYSQLSDREREVLQLIAEGRSIRDIGDYLHLSINTVHTHRKHLMEKLGLHSNAELTKCAIREGLTEI